MSSDNNGDDALIRLPELLKRVPMSKSQLWLMVRQGRFPKPYKPSERISAWRLSEVSDWMDSLPKE